MNKEQIVLAYLVDTEYSLLEEQDHKYDISFDGARFLIESKFFGVDRVEGKIDILDFTIWLAKNQDKINGNVGE